MILSKWNLDTDTFTFRIRVRDKCVLTDEAGYKHFHMTRAFCISFEVSYDPELALEALVDSEQAIWADLTEVERINYMNERPWWQKLKDWWSRRKQNDFDRAKDL